LGENIKFEPEVFTNFFGKYLLKFIIYQYIYRYLDGECIDPFHWPMDSMPAECMGMMKYALANNDVMVACTDVPEISTDTLPKRDPLGNSSFLACVTETHKCLKVVQNFKWISEDEEEWDDLEVEIKKED